MNTKQPACRLGPGACPASRIGLVSIDNGTAVPMICHVLPGGDVVVTAASGHAWVEDVAGHIVRIEFTACDSADCRPLVVSSGDRAVRVVAVVHRRWSLHTDMLIATDPVNSAVREQGSSRDPASARQ